MKNSLNRDKMLTTPRRNCSCRLISYLRSPGDVISRVSVGVILILRKEQCRVSTAITKGEAVIEWSVAEFLGTICEEELWHVPENLHMWCSDTWIAQSRHDLT